MPDNPPAPVVEPTATKKTVTAIKQFSSRHNEGVTLGVGVLLGGLLATISRLVP